ncbi:MAG: hypothetical protein WA906_08155 [Pacificimonas sp.]
MRTQLRGPLGSLPRWALAILVLAALALIYWGIGGAIMSDTDADLSQRPSAEMLPPGGSVTVATLSTSTLSELDRGGWTPNATMLKPTGLLEEMPSFQRGVYALWAPTAGALAALSGGDELTEAAELLSTRPGRGFLHAEFPFIGGSAGSRYRDAVTALDAANAEFAAVGDRPFATAASARALVGAIGGQLTSAVRTLDRRIMAADAEPTEDALSYQEIRGLAYASTLLLRGIQADHDDVLRQRELSPDMVEAIEAFDRVASTDPWSVDDGDRTEQAYILRAGVAALARLRSGLA